MNSGQDQIMTIEQQTCDLVEKTLHKTGGNMAMAARLLGIGRATIYRLIQKHGIINRRSK